MGCDAHLINLSQNLHTLLYSYNSRKGGYGNPHSAGSEANAYVSHSFTDELICTTAFFSWSRNACALIGFAVLRGLACPRRVSRMMLAPRQIEFPLYAESDGHRLLTRTATVQTLRVGSRNVIMAGKAATCAERWPNTVVAVMVPLTITAITSYSMYYITYLMQPSIKILEQGLATEPTAPACMRLQYVLLSRLKCAF